MTRGKNGKKYHRSQNIKKKLSRIAASILWIEILGGDPLPTVRSFSHPLPLKLRRVKVAGHLFRNDSSFSVQALKREIEELKDQFFAPASRMRIVVTKNVDQLRRLCFSIGQRKIVTNNHTIRSRYEVWPTDVVCEWCPIPSPQQQTARNDSAGMLVNFCIFIWKHAAARIFTKLGDLLGTFMQRHRSSRVYPW